MSLYTYASEQNVDSIFGIRLQKTNTTLTAMLDFGTMKIGTAEIALANKTMLCGLTVSLQTSSVLN